MFFYIIVHINLTIDHQKSKLNNSSIYLINLNYIFLYECIDFVILCVFFSVYHHDYGKKF